MINNKGFPDRLEKIMEYYDLTATALAEKIDFNRSSISHLISGRNNPSLEFVVKVIENFPEITWKWLVQGKGTFPTKNDQLEEEPIPREKTTPARNLFSQDSPQNSHPISKADASIERIVVFYKNGTFKNYVSS